MYRLLLAFLVVMLTACTDATSPEPTAPVVDNGRPPAPAEYANRTCGSWVESWSYKGVTYIIVHVLPDCPK